MKYLLLSFFAIALSFSLAMPAPAFAAPTTGQNSFPSTVGGNTPPSTYGNNSTFTLVDPLGVRNFCDLVKTLLNIVLAIGIPVAVLFLMWAGFKFIVARGSSTGLEVAKRNFKYVIFGIALFLGAWTFATVISATIQTLDTSGTIQFCGR